MVPARERLELAEIAVRRESLLLDLQELALGTALKRLAAVRRVVDAEEARRVESMRSLADVGVRVRTDDELEDARRRRAG